MEAVAQLTKEIIEKSPWWGDQRAQVTALLARVEKAEEFIKGVAECCEPVATGTGGDGDALNTLCFLYAKAKAFAE